MLKKALDQGKREVTVMSGIRLDELRLFLRDKGYEINCLEEYIGSDLRVKDLLFSTFYGRTGGKLIDDCIREMTVVLPKEQEVLILKDHSETSKNPINTKSMFLRNDFILGLPYSVTFSIENKKNLKAIEDSKCRQKYREGSVMDCIERDNVIYALREGKGSRLKWRKSDFKFTAPDEASLLDLWGKVKEQLDSAALLEGYELSDKRKEVKVQLKGKEEDILDRMKSVGKEVEAKGGKIYSYIVK